MPDDDPRSDDDLVDAANRGDHAAFEGPPIQVQDRMVTAFWISSSAYGMGTCTAASTSHRQNGIDIY